jgi:malonyl CoA-acyl carrier protein transacylase
MFELAASVSKAVGSKCSVANILCQGNIVLSGNSAACDEIAKQGESFGASKTVRLAVAGAFHSGKREEKEKKKCLTSKLCRIHAPCVWETRRSFEQGENKRNESNYMFNFLF